MDNDTSTFEIIKRGTNQYNLKYKIILVGDAAVGKSCICIKQTKNLFINDYIATNNYEAFNSDVKYKDLSIKLQILDTSGNEFFNSIIRLLFREASLVLIVYAINE